MFVTQTVVPVVLAPLLFGESFADTPLGGRAARALAGAAGRGRRGARALAAAARPDGAASAISHDSGSAASPSAPSARDDPLERRHRGRASRRASTTSTSPGARRALRQRRRSRSGAARPLTGVAPAVRASTSCPTRQPAAGLQEVEVVVQPQRARLRAQHRRALRTQRSSGRVGHFGQQLVAERAHPGDASRASGTPASSAKETWMPRRASSRRDERLISRCGHAHDHADVALIGVDTCASGCTCRTFAASAVTSSVDIIHEPPQQSSERQPQRHGESDHTRGAPAASAGSGAPGAGAGPEHRRSRPPPGAGCRGALTGGVGAAVSVAAPGRLRRSSPARARAARSCRWPVAAGRGRPSRACSAARARPAARRRRRACPAAFASRQVTPPVECTSTSAAASSSGISSVNP